MHARCTPGARQTLCCAYHTGPDAGPDAGPDRSIHKGPSYVMQQAQMQAQIDDYNLMLKQSFEEKERLSQEMEQARYLVT